MEWNPSRPNKIGMQFAARARQGEQRSRSIRTYVDAAAMHIDSTLTEALNYFRQAFMGVETDSAVWGVEEWLIAGQEVAGELETETYRPSAASVDNMETNTGSTSSAAIAGILDNTSVDLTSYVRSRRIPPTDGAYFPPTVILRFPTLGQLTGRRILSVRFFYVGMEVPGENGGYGGSIFGAGVSGSSGTVGSWPGGTQDMFPAPFGSSEQPQRRLLETGESVVQWNSGQELPLTSSLIQDFDASQSDMAFVMRAHNLNSDESKNSEFRLFQTWMEVDHCAENRRAVRFFSLSESDTPIWREVNPRLPDGSGAWSGKTDGQDVVAVLRRLRTGNRIPGRTPPRDFAVPLLDAWGGLPASTGLIYYPSIALEGDGRVRALGPPSDASAFGHVWIVDPTSSIDSQPYTSVEEVPVHAGSGTRAQEVSGATAQEYDGVRFPVLLDETEGPVDDLTVELRRRGDNALMATVTVTKADYEAAPAEPTLGHWRMIQKRFDASVVLAPATQYAVTWASPGVGSWVLQMLSARTDPDWPPIVASDTYGTSARYAPGTYNQGADVAEVDSLERSWADFSVLVYVEPDPVTGFSIFDTHQDIPTHGGCPGAGCHIGIPTVTLTWDPTVLGSMFGAYEIQRLDPWTDWQTIARITAPGVTAFVDYEPRLSVTSDYRMRQLDTDMFASAWTPVLQATPMPDGPGYTFTTNEAPELNLAYADVYTGPVVREYGFRDAEDSEEAAMYQRPFRVKFSRPEDGGIVFTRALNVERMAAAKPGPGVFDALRRLARMPLSYVCVRDESGARVFAGLTVGEGSMRLQGGEEVGNIATVRVGEVTDLPSVPDSVL